MDYLCRHAEIKILASCYLKPRWFKTTTCPAIRYRLAEHKIGQPLIVCLGIWIPLVFKTGGPYDREIISQWMFYRSLLDSLLYLSALSLLVSLDSLTLVQLFEGEKKQQQKKALFIPPPLFFFVITKEQTHIKHTQGAEAVIAVSAVLLWVAGDDNISHRFIYIFFLYSCQAQIMVSWEMRNIGEKRCFRP